MADRQMKRLVLERREADIRQEVHRVLVEKVFKSKVDVKSVEEWCGT